MNVSTKPVSRQAADVYKVLEDGGALTVNQIAERLCVLPNAIYRVTNKLVKLGMIEEVSGYPARFRANPPQSAMNWYLQTVAESFRQEFPAKSTPSQSQGVKLSVIRDRNSSLRRSAADAATARESINFIVSGLETPDDVILAFRKAALRGVAIRVIVQQKRETSKQRLEKWQAIGAQVRYLPNVGIRMFVFDGQIAQINSYTPDNRENALGVRFVYPPLAEQMNLLFEQNWQKAAPL
jgi:sugar-specific transcriptional regulator TrmB